MRFLGNHLQLSRNLGITDMKNKNAAACRCANTRKPAQVLGPPTQRPLAAPHGILYDIPALPARGGFCRCILVPVLHKSFRFLRCVGVSPARRFCFSPGACGGKSPRGAAVKNSDIRPPPRENRILYDGLVLSNQLIQGGIAQWQIHSPKNPAEKESNL